MRAGGRGRADGGGQEQPVKRGDGGNQPGRGPGLEEAPEQPAGPVAGLRRGGGGVRATSPALSLPGQKGEKSRLNSSQRHEG